MPTALPRPVAMIGRAAEIGQASEIGRTSEIGQASPSTIHWGIPCIAGQFLTLKWGATAPLRPTRASPERYR